MFIHASVPALKPPFRIGATQDRTSEDRSCFENAGTTQHHGLDQAHIHGNGTLGQPVGCEVERNEKQIQLLAGSLRYGRQFDSTLPRNAAQRKDAEA